jgi:hypothetical protein
VVTRALAAVGAAAAVVTLVAVATRPGAPTPALPRRGIVASVTVAPRAVLFGDTLRASVHVLLDRRRFDPSSVHVRGGFGPYEADAAGKTRRDQGHATRLTYVFRLTCLVQSCLPADPVGGGRSEVAFTPAHLVFRDRRGREGSALLRPPPVEVTSRLAPEEAAIVGTPLPPPLRVDDSSPPVTYAIAPSLLSALLLAAAALLLALAVWLVLRELPRLRAQRVRVPSPLERALAFVQRALDDGAVPEQRKALELLAAELGRTGEERLAGSARVLAWARPSPLSAGADALAADVRRTLAEETNGRP